jgi:fermentation-respiration switch protein FrsA (DUF1100 family)
MAAVRRTWISKISERILVAALFSFSGCTPLVNVLSFFPDRSTYSIGDNISDVVSRRFIEVERRVKLECFYLPCTTSKKLLIYFHGNAGNIAQRIPTLIDLWRMNVSVLGVGYRGYGASSGRPSERGVYKDGEAAFNYGRDTLGFGEENIFLFGRSIGSTVAVATARERNLAGVILITPLSTGNEYARAHGWGPLSFLSGNCFDNISKAAMLKSPVLIIHGTDDEVVPYRLGKRLFDAIATEKKLVTIDKGLHNTLEHTDPALFWTSISRFLQGGI